MIADEGAAVALAGIIGGADSAVGPATTGVIIEAASFEATGVRATSRRLGLRTEASSRFEKRLHPDLAGLGAMRLAELLQQVAGAGPSSVPADAYPAPLAVQSLRVEAGFVGQRLGEPLDDVEVSTWLRRLGFGAEAGADGITVTPAPYRLDIAIPEDVVEEVGRLRGYNALPGTLPGSRQPVGRLLPPPDPEWTGRDLVMAAGLDEVITSSFARRSDPAALGPFPGKRLELANPMSSEEDSMRTTLLPGLARALAANAALGTPEAWIFELGRVFWPVPGRELPDEARLLGLAVSLRSTGRQAVRRALLEIKGILDAVSTRLTGQPVQLEPEPVAGFHPGRSARLAHDGRLLGAVGELDPEVARAFDLAGAVVVAELNFDLLAQRLRPPRYAAPSRFPAVVRDIAVTVSIATPASDVIGTALATGEVILRSVEVFDEYAGGQVEPGRKGLALRLTYQADDRTLSGEEVAAAEARIAASMAAGAGARPRE